jgi:hypothetical protein
MSTFAQQMLKQTQAALRVRPASTSTNANAGLPQGATMWPGFGNRAVGQQRGQRHQALKGPAKSARTARRSDRSVIRRHTPGWNVLEKM